MCLESEEANSTSYFPTEALFRHSAALTFSYDLQHVLLGFFGFFLSPTLLLFSFVCDSSTLSIVIKQTGHLP